MLVHTDRNNYDYLLYQGAQFHDQCIFAYNRAVDSTHEHCNLGVTRCSFAAGDFLNQAHIIVRVDCGRRSFSVAFCGY